MRRACPSAVAAAALIASMLALDAPAQSTGAAPATNAAGDCDTGLPGGSRATSAGQVVAWRADPPKIPVGRHFAVDLLVCARPGFPVASVIAIDARMPSHGHGMNYKPTLTPLGGNRYRAEGLLFHMPGQWELVFDLRGGDKAERATQVVTVR